MGELWWTVDEDMLTYVMKSRTDELIEEKLNQEFPEGSRNKRKSRL